ncbi:hypothetical protein MUP77_24915, partial [Candidatus Bathyarchaeota archaeon]|nr:hypothetical protein [Candidatus Bathyarchaeota archaeon]
NPMTPSLRLPKFVHSLRQFCYDRIPFSIRKTMKMNLTTLRPGTEKRLFYWTGNVLAQALTDNPF